MDDGGEKQHQWVKDGSAGTEEKNIGAPVWGVGGWLRERAGMSILEDEERDKE